MRPPLRIHEIESYCVLICAYNEEARVGDVVERVLSLNPGGVVVVDDGSTDHTALVAEDAGAHVIRLEQNQGKGAALRRGFTFILECDFDAVVVVDADGQHDPAEIPRFIKAYERTGIPVLVGNRMADTRGMPFLRKWTNRVMSRVLNRLVKIYVADPPCGYRFYHTDILPFILSSEKRFAFEFDILLHAALRRIRVDSVRISTIYHADGRRSHVAPLRDAFLLFRCIVDHFPVRKGRAVL
jgi:glycosyltransferase involved in cell wall biosynthesis